MTRDELIDKMAKAGAKVEGFFNKGKPTRAQLNNNPGNVRQSKAPYDYVKYETLEDGWRAMRWQLMICVFGGGPSAFPLRNKVPLTWRTLYAGQRDEKGNVLVGGYPGYAPKGDGGNDPRVYSACVFRDVVGRPMTDEDYDEAVRSLATS